MCLVLEDCTVLLYWFQESWYLPLYYLYFRPKANSLTAAAIVMAWSALAFCLSKLGIIPSFPRYSGPYKVGTVDVELPVDDLESPSPVPSPATAIATIQFRIYYPAVPDSLENYIRWLPNPQRHQISSYARFMGIGALLADIIAYKFQTD